jgi:hypothetical protein
LTIDSPESAVKRITSAPKRLAPRYRKTRRFNPIWKRYQAWRKNITGVVKGPLPFFWGVSKSV